MTKTLELPSVIQIKTTFGTYDFPLDNVPDEMLRTALIFGYQSKLSNSAAKGKDASLADKRAAVEKMVAQLRDHVWNQKAGGGGAPLTTEEVVLREFLVAKFIKAGVKKSVATDEARNVDTRAGYFKDVCVLPALRAKDPIRLNDDPAWADEVALKLLNKMAADAVDEAARRDAITDGLDDDVSLVI